MNGKYTNDKVKEDNGCLRRSIILAYIDDSVNYNVKLAFTVNLDGHYLDVKIKLQNNCAVIDLKTTGVIEGTQSDFISKAKQRLRAINFSNYVLYEPMYIVVQSWIPTNGSTLA